MTTTELFELLKTHPGHSEDLCWWCMEVQEKIQKAEEYDEKYISELEYWRRQNS